MIKTAIQKLRNEMNQENLIELLLLLAQSTVIMPCHAAFSMEDMQQIREMIEKAGDDPEAIKGETFTTKGETRLVPDILQNGNEFFFPVFTSEEEMGEYGNDFSKVPCSFMHAIKLAENSSQELRGIVINAFTDPFVVDNELLKIVRKIDGRLREQENQ